MGHAVRGLRTVWREESNFRIHCGVAVAVLGGAVMFGFSFTEISVLFFAILLVLGSEILNTVVEDAYDALHPDHHRVVGKIKDMMAGLVLLNAMGAAAIGTVTVLHHFLPGY
jgi:diacylglycerol kinase